MSSFAPKPGNANLTIRQLEVFTAASRATNFSEAAHRLGISQPSLSVMIAKIEEQLGATLFRREGRRTSLTPEGARFAAASADLVRHYRNALRSLGAPRLQERIAVAMPPSAAASIAPGALRAFTALYPDHMFVLRDVDRREALSLLMGGSVDFAIIVDPPTLVDFVREPFHVDSFQIVVSADAQWAREAALNWSDLAAMPLILAGSLQTRGYIEAAWQHAGVDLTPRCEVEQVSTGLGLAAAGLGFLLLPSLYLPRPLPENLRAVALHSRRLERHLDFMYPAATPLSPAARAMLSCLRDELAGA